jgi:two-component system, chemotaxis family, CheB/CheR fusion protein
MTASNGDYAGDFEALLQFLKDERGFDFTGYKRPSLTRRIGNRMQQTGHTSYDDYRAHLERAPVEFNELFNTILINVTSFFRDDVAWAFLREEIVAQIVAAREGPEPIRVWSTGCATGEEAFSLAMTFAEALGVDDFRRRVKIYATDIDEDALTTGRHARYTAKQLEPVPDELRDRYFEAANGAYLFRKDLRRTVIFGRHDLIQDPPISRIDLLASRNTLMYFDTETQTRILTDFHFALRDDGFLFLGKSEALAARTTMFAPVDGRRRVFAKIPRRAGGQRIAERAALTIERVATADSLLRDASFDAGPVAQLVVDQHGILTMANLPARGMFGLTQRDVGRPFKDLDVSFRPVELRSRIEQAARERHAVTLREVEWPNGSDLRFVDVQVTPLLTTTGEQVGAGITFTDVTRYRQLQQALQESRREIETAYEELQSTVEELETTNEELQSTNEELETTNEELHSTNEELETTNEELHSTNEELETMNEELLTRGRELNEANAFLDAVLGSLEAGVVIVDSDLQVQAWNHGAHELWGLSPDEAVGQHFLNLDIGLPIDRLRSPIKTALGAEADCVPPVRLEAVNRRGRQLEVVVTLTPLQTVDGNRQDVIVMMHPAESVDAQ